MAKFILVQIYFAFTFFTFSTTHFNVTQTTFNKHNETECIHQIFPTSDPQVFQQLEEQFSPYTVTSDLITFVCSHLLATQTLLAYPPWEANIQYLKFILHTPHVKESIPLLNTEVFVNNPHFDIRKKVIVFVTGWRQTPRNSTFVNDMAKAFHCRGSFNFLALDDADYLNTLMYPWAAVNTDTLGRHIAKALTQLIKYMPTKNIYLVGHSLGAQVVGSAGRYFKSYTNQMLPRLTGLDPAKPCFQNGLSGLRRNDALFVDIIHTNPGVLGIKEAMGDVDFYVNGLSPLVEGCPGILCAHLRSISYFIETIYPYNERNFLAYKNKSYEEIPMGFAVPHTARGCFYLDVNPSAPYGKNSTPTVHDNNKKCKSFDTKLLTRS